MMEMLQIEDLEYVRKQKEKWTRWEALVEVGLFDYQKKEEEERAEKRRQEKKRRRDEETAAAFPSRATKKHGKNRPRPRQQPANGEPPPEMPERFRQKIMEMGGEDVTFVIEKALFWTDTSSQHNRLSMPMNQIRRDFTTEEERRTLGSKDANANGIEVILIDPSLEEEEVMLKQWKMKETSIMYVLIKNWYCIAKRNGLNVNSVIRVWTFRVESKLCFAVVRVENEEDGRKGKAKGKKEDGGSGSGTKGEEVEKINGGSNEAESTSHANAVHYS